MIKKISFAFFLFISTFFFACGQEHKDAQNWLEKFNNAGQATVVLNNEKALLPLKKLEIKTIASIDLGYKYHSIFDSILNKYADIKTFPLTKDLNALNADLKFFNTIIIQVTDSTEFNDEILFFINQMENTRQVVINYFGEGKNLAKLNNVKAPIVFSPVKDQQAASFSAQLIFGGVACLGRLPISFSDKYQRNTGFDIDRIRLQFTVPEDLNINANDLKAIDEIAAEAIRNKATPGMVVFAAKDGKVIFNKAYGAHTYDTDAQKESVNDIFDLASITKVGATTMEVMHLYETNQLDLDTTIDTYLAQARNTDKADIKVKELMLHQAGFIPYIPFFSAIKPDDFSRDSSEVYNVKVADNYFMKKSYFNDVMWKQMLASPLKTRGKYVYSDLSMYFMKEVIEQITKTPLQNYVKTNFYNPLGMSSTGFNPRYRFTKSEIVPTELDTYFRKTLLMGYVHDQGAAMVGGVSGHAGLFSNASDLAILFQMLLNRGEYGGDRYFKPEIVNFFTTKYSELSRRGLGFDGFDSKSTYGYPSKFASSQSYGHTGYTGTCVWVDPKENLIYILLSNRVNPEVNNKLSTLNIRPRIQDVIYKAIQNARN
ncbi:beta-N-acetylglucosaminidase [Pedobacter psychrophilus]|uniref:Beta-N-acetylglucosaminidase n=1 Tax=Pedobacter psychrophilus TaxID=1826909 RepID=A0A179DDG9_9SPHI|nr:serine hydrolase [Pedobacter psychrophilus]OAQ39076.1 beta-N-acetylglucosaminidase [Pedobacter psychrophilus]